MSKPVNGGDTRKPIKGRTVTSVFGFYKRGVHLKPSNVLTHILVAVMIREFVRNIPFMLRLRRKQKQRQACSGRKDISVAFYSDNLDEVNGIANSLRSVVCFMRAKGYKVQLWGSAFNTRDRGVVEDHFTVLFPRAASMEQLGYADSELALPYLKPVLKMIGRYPVDLLELETPSPGAWLVGIVARIVGVKVISHYRTDVPSYTRTLVRQRWMQNYVLWLMQVFYRFTVPVISPCEEYRKKLLEEIRIKDSKFIKVLPRGIPLENFEPSLRSKAPDEPVRFIYVGRISKEKDIPFLEELWKKFARESINAELMFVGGGWYLETLKNNLKAFRTVHYEGVQTGKELAKLYANADFFLFPSGTDTFGNVIVESLASGTPAIVTDQGGPQDIVRNTACGFVLPFRDLDAWNKKLIECCRLRGTDEYAAMRSACIERSKDYTLEKMVTAQWDFFHSLLFSTFT